MNSLTNEEFKQKFKEKYGTIYNLEKAEYINNKTEVVVICPIHGEFKKRPDLLLSGGKCPKCSKTAKMDEDEFVKKAKLVHNGFFEYVKGSFKNTSSKVSIICPIHGEFEQKANNHLNGAGCMKCKLEGIKHNISKLKKKNKTTKHYDQETFIEKAKLVCGENIILDKVIYKNNRTPIEVICKEHGSFLITPNHLLSGRGCPKCAKNYRYTTDEIIKQFKLVFGDKYDYGKTRYTNTHNNVIVTCKKHGDFNVSPANHLRGEECPLCKTSKLEEEIRMFLNNKNINYKFRCRDIPCLNGLELDFFLTDYNVGIECQGIQHFQAIPFFGGENYFKEIMRRDKEKKSLCEKNDIKLLYYSNLGLNYPYKVFENKNELLKEIINE